jgi:serine/threonine-protein kinase
VVLFDLGLDAGRLDVAEAAAAELERLVPGDVGALRRRAELAEAQGEGGRALELMREVIARRPAAGYLMNLANMQLHLGEAAAARATLEDLLRRFPTHLRGEKLLAQVELQAGSPARAAELYTDLLRRRRGFSELSNLGVAQLLLGDWPGAAASLEEAYALAPQSAPAALNLADAMTLAGRSQEAATLYTRVLELVAQDPAPGYWQTLSVEAQALAHLGRSPEAAAAIQQATAAAPDNPQLAYEAALVYALIGEPASALASAQRAIAGGFDRRWFALPFFDPLHVTPGWSEAVAPQPAPTP